MKRICLILILFTLLGIAGTMPDVNRSLDTSEELRLMDRLLSTETLKSEIFPQTSVLELAVRGYNRLLHDRTVPRPEILTVIDYSLPSDVERMWVFNMKSGKLLFNSLVAHGRNSGERFASRFSNVSGSYTSSLGFYLTGDTYTGQNGLSLYLDGLEAGINDHARERAIVIHGADYATKNFILQNGRLGRSFGCPALPPELTKEVINTIEGGSCLFIYAPDESYLHNSPFLN